MTPWNGRTAVITGAASGFGLETSRLAAKVGMNLVMADVQQAALDTAADEMRGLGAQVLAQRLDVSKAAEVEALGAAVLARFGAPHFVFNNAGVGCGGLIWEQTLKDWEWVLGVNLMGVAHGVRVFTPMMLAAAQADPAYEGHIVNTASMAGLVNPPNMGAYNVSKHAVVSMSESLYHDLALVTEQVHAHVLCPFYVATGIVQSYRNRPEELRERGAKPTASQMLAHAMIDKAVTGSKVTAEQVAQLVFDAMPERRFYIYSHPQALAAVQTRLEDVMQARNPSDPLQDKPEIAQQIKAALRAAG